MWKTIRNLFKYIFSFLTTSEDKADVFPEVKQKFSKDDSLEFDHSDAINLSDGLIIKEKLKTKPDGDARDKFKDDIDSIQELTTNERVEAGTQAEGEDNRNDQPIRLLDESNTKGKQSNDLVGEHLEKIEDQIKSQQRDELIGLDESSPSIEIRSGDKDEPPFNEKNQKSDDIGMFQGEDIIDLVIDQSDEEFTEVINHFFDEPIDDVDSWVFDDPVELDDDVEQFVDETDDEKDETEPEPKLERHDKHSKTPNKNVERKRVRKLFYYETHTIPTLDDEYIDKLAKLTDEGRLAIELGYDIQQVEIFLLNILPRYDLIGELPFGRKSFDYICDLLQKKYIKNNRPKVTRVPPALFVTAMVFCARYSEEEARNFWKPYANIVWGMEPSQYFQNVSRKHFVDCKIYLQTNYGFVFPVINTGDVVRPVYHQAVIPYYLQSNFAEWLVDRFEKLLAFSIDDLPYVLSEEKSLDYVPPRLRNFVRQGETSETAAKLVQQMAKAVRLFQTTEQFEAVNSVMSSPIERSLWREIYQDLIEKRLQLDKIRKHTPKLEWVWDIDHNDLYLLLSQVRSSKEEKPNLIVWAKKGSRDLRNEDILLYIHPWQLSNGDWELDPETITDKGDLDGKIYVLSDEYDLEKNLGGQDDHVIIEKDIPEIEPDVLFFFVSTNRSVAREKEKININGDWIIISKDHVEIIDHTETTCAYDDLYLPSVLRESGYQFARKYSLTLPAILKTERGEITYKETQSTFVAQAELIGKNQITGLSNNVQPIFQSSNVVLKLDAQFTETQLARTWISIHKHGNFLNSISLAELQKKKLFYKGDSYFISLKEFVNEPGSYSVNILHDLQLLLEENLRFAYLPDVTIIGPDPNTCYSPAKPLEIRLSGVDKRQIKTSIEDKVKIEQSDKEFQLLWKELRFPQCRFSLQWGGNNINLSWNINRVTAWIDGGGDKRNIIAGQEGNVILNARGDSKEEIVWFIKDTNHRRKINLDYQGFYRRGLNQSALRDLLRNSDLVQSQVAISIREHTWDVFTYNKIPSLNIKSISYENPHLNILLAQSERLKGAFAIQIRDKVKTISPFMISRIDRLDDKNTFEIDLLPGKYQVEILLGNEILAVSKEITVQEKIVEVVQIPKRVSLLMQGEEVTSQRLYDNLTSDQKSILRINEKSTSNLISILKQLVKINLPETWVTSEKLNDGLKKLLPSWAVLQYPLRFYTQEHNRFFYIFPQQVAFGAKAGKGYLSVKLEHDPVKIYAAWNSDFTQNKTYLWVMIPQVDTVEKFCDLDEYDLWPGYQCVDCGVIVGSKSGNYLRLSPQTTVTHIHGKKRTNREQFIDVVYRRPIEVKISEYRKKNLSHCYWPDEVVGDNYFNDLFDGKMRPLQGEINIPIDVFNITDYYIAISEAYQNYTNQSFQISIKQIISKENLFNKIRDFVLEKRDDIPAFSAALRLDQQILSKKRLFFLPKYVLLLSLALRLKAYNPHLYQDLIGNDEVPENGIIDLTFQAMNSCPKLLEWSIAWVEIFFNHAIS